LVAFLFGAHNLGVLTLEPFFGFRVLGLEGFGFRINLDRVPNPQTSNPNRKTATALQLGVGASGLRISGAGLRVEG